MNKIFISINNQKELSGVVYTYCQDSYKIDRFIEGNNNFLKKIQMKNNLMKYLKEGQSLILVTKYCPTHLISFPLRTSLTIQSSYESLQLKSAHKTLPIGQTL